MIEITTDQSKALAALLADNSVQSFVAGAKALDAGELGQFDMIINTAAVDRDGEIVEPAGAVIDNYLKNPIVLAFHNYWQMPIGVTTDLTLESGGWRARGMFAPTDAGQEARLLYESGFLRTASVGFIPLERDQSSKKITKWELLEWSFVPVPCNPEALTVTQRAVLDSLSKRYEMPAGTAEEAEKLITKAVSFSLSKSPEPEEEAQAPQQQPIQSTPAAKAGRVLSDKNRALLGDCAAKLSEALDALEELLNSTDLVGDTPPQDTEEGKGSTPESNILRTSTPTQWDTDADYRVIKGAVSILGGLLQRR